MSVAGVRDLRGPVRFLSATASIDDTHGDL